MHAIVLIAVTCALALAREAADTPVDHCGWRVLLTAGSIFSLAGAARLLTLAGCDDDGLPDTTPRRIRWLEDLHLVAWMAVAAFQVFVIDWVTVVRTNWRLQQTILLDELIILVPLVLPWLISWSMFYELDSEQLGVTCSPRRSGGRIHFVAHHARLVLGLGLLPVLAVCLISDLWNVLAPARTRDNGAPLILAASLIAALLLYPSILCRLWRTTPLPPGPLRRRLQSLADRHQVRLRDMLIWHTDERVMNAVATGILPRLRYVFLSDRLLSDLTDDEIEAAFAHELAHIRLGHLGMRTIALLVPLSACLLLDGVGRWQGHALIAPDAGRSGSHSIMAVGALAATLIYMAVGIGWYARRLEHQADLWACDHLCPPGSDRQAGRARYLPVLRRMTAALPRHGRGWLHPGWPERRGFLVATLHSPNAGTRFSRQMNWIAVAVCGWTLAGAVCLLLR